MAKPSFRTKLFMVQQDRCALKVGTDSILFGTWVEYEGASRILDIGTGTGVLALIAAQRNPIATIHGVEIDEDSADQAKQNVAASPWARRSQIQCMDIRSMQEETRFDLIICNPPYYANYMRPQDERVGVAKHNDQLSFSDLIHAVDRLLVPDGRFAVIVPVDREEELQKEARKVSLFATRRCRVRYVPHRPPKRVLLEFDRSTGEVQDTELTIEASGPFDYSAAYRAQISDVMVGF